MNSNIVQKFSSPRGVSVVSKYKGKILSKKMYDENPDIQAALPPKEEVLRAYHSLLSNIDRQNSYIMIVDENGITISPNTITMWGSPPINPAF